MPKDEPPKIKVVYGPSRSGNELYYPEEYGTYWGATHGPMFGTPTRENDSRREPPQYIESCDSLQVGQQVVFEEKSP